MRRYLVHIFLTLLGLMECAVKFDTVKLGRSIVYIEGSHNMLSEDTCTYSSADRFCHVKQCRPR